VRSSPDLHVLGTWQDKYLLYSPSLSTPRSVCPSQLFDLLNYTSECNLSTTHLNVVDSLALLSTSIPTDASTSEVTNNSQVPRTIHEALSPAFVDVWGPAVDSELSGFQKYQCFQPVPVPPEGIRTIPGHWLFSVKRNGTPKARFVMGGHRQRIGIDYFEYKNYAAVLSSRDNRILLSWAAAQGMKVYQTDIQQAFLHGLLEEDIYIHPPARYPCPPGHVLKLLKAVYGLHQGPVQFKKEVTDWLRAEGYTPVNDSETIWILRTEKGVLVHAIYADDFLHFCNSQELYSEFKVKIKRKFDIKTGEVDNYLGNKITVNGDEGKVCLDQVAYLDELLRKFGMDKSTPVKTPMEDRLSEANRGKTLTKEDQAKYRMIVGSLLYLACWTRPDISFAVSELSRFVSSAGEVHMKAAQRVLRYLKGTRELGLQYKKSNDQVNVLWGCVDSDWAGCLDTRRSTSGYVLLLNGCAVSWKSKRQSVVALSSAEAEFMAASSLVQEVIAVRKLLEKLGVPQKEPTTIGEDNRTCIAWSEGSVGGSDRAKHIDLRKHFVHEAVLANYIKLEAVRSSDNLADIFTKPLPKSSFESLRNRIMGL
jgi:hypothetical protein